MITLPLTQPTIMIQFFIILKLPFSQEPTIEHRPSYNFHFLDLLQHHFWPFPSRHDRLLRFEGRTRTKLPQTSHKKACMQQSSKKGACF